MTAALEGSEWSATGPGRALPPGKTRYPLYRRLGGPQGLSGQVRKISPPPGVDPRTVQPVVSRYTDWATRPTAWSMYVTKFTIFEETLKTYKNNKKLGETSALCVPSRRTNKRAVWLWTENQKQLTSRQFHGSQRGDGFLQRKEFWSPFLPFTIHVIDSASAPADMDCDTKKTWGGGGWGWGRTREISILNECE